PDRDMTPPSPVEPSQPSCTPSPDTKPTTNRLSAWVTKLLHAWAKLHVSYRGGRYSIERLLALDEYTRNTSLLRVLLVCVTTPLPMAMLVISQEFVPFQDPRDGWRVNYGYWIRADILTVVVTHTLVVQAKFLVEGFAMSWRQIVLFVACSIVFANIPAMVVSAYWAFPIPFGFLVMSPSFYTQLLASFYAIVGIRVIREILTHQDQLTRYINFVTAQELMAIIYPAYQVLFHAMINTPYKLPVILLLPVIKLIVKNIVLRCVTHMEDMMPEAVIFTVDFFNALYLATCMESAASTTTVLIIVTTDLAQTATVLNDAFQHTISTEETQPAENLSLLTTHCNILGETLEALFTSECIVLTAYLETFIPVFYGNFMLIMVRLPSAKYHTELTGVTAENVGTEVHTVFLFATLQLLSFVLLSTLIRRNLGMKSLYQLAFVLETQMELIQSKLMTWALMTMAFRVVHFGTLSKTAAMSRGHNTNAALHLQCWLFGGLMLRRLWELPQLLKRLICLRTFFVSGL
ncbi:hypothetical protein BBJ28_00022596, partial [Nothophytophthora sp. Chile5]